MNARKFRIEHGPSGASIEPVSEYHGSLLGEDDGKDPVTADILREQLAEIPDVIETIGRIVRQMREGAELIEDGQEEYGVSLADDSATELPELIGKLKRMRSELEKYAL